MQKNKQDMNILYQFVNNIKAHDNNRKVFSHFRRNISTQTGAQASERFGDAVETGFTHSGLFHSV